MNNTNDIQSEQSLSDNYSRWKERLTKTLLAIFFYAGNLLLNALLVSIIHERVPLDMFPLPDISFDFLPYWPMGLFITECYIFILYGMVLLLLLLHRSGHRIAQRFCIIMGIIYFFRAITISVTQLPVSANRLECMPQMENNVTSTQFINTIIKRTLNYIPTLGTYILTTEPYCGALLYSGHTISIVIGYSFISTYLIPAEVKANSLSWWLYDFILYWLSIIAVLLTLIARANYLVDVIFAYYISTSTFYIYHTICSHESLHYATSGNFFTKLWWWPLFTFFEVDNQDRIVVVNRFYNPINVLWSWRTENMNRTMINNVNSKSDTCNQSNVNHLLRTIK